MYSLNVPEHHTDAHDQSSISRTPTEEVAMARALNRALREPDVVTAVRDFRLNPDVIRERITASDADIWARVSAERAGVRDAERDLEPVAQRLDAYEIPRWIRWLLVASGLAMVVITIHTIYALFAAPRTVFNWSWDHVGGWTILLSLLSLTILGIPGTLQTRAIRDFRRQIRIEEAEQRLAAAEVTLQDALNSIVADQAREVVNEETEIPFEPRFLVTNAPGLRRLADPSLEVPTRARADLTRALAGLEAGSIGISGPRGVGKTTLIRYFCDGRHLEGPEPEDFVGLFVSAPVRYEAREFVLHLFASLCEKVIGRAEVERMRREGLWALRERARQQGARGLNVIAGVLGGTGLAIFVGEQIDISGGAASSAGITLMIMSALSAIASSLIQRTPDLEGLSLPAVVRIGLAQALPTPIRHRARLELESRRNERTFKTIEERAVHHLREIKYQQTQAVGWTGAGALPPAFKLGYDEKTTIAQAPLTLPEIIASYSSFIAEVSGGRTVIVGIDELDKMESDAVAHRFLNDIKGVFGEGASHYLVSVSEDAMSSFERRGLPLRDVFDSSFDQIVQIPYLEFDEARQLLRRRVIRLSMGFQCLCFCLAGGLPRDLIRYTRELVELGLSGPDQDLAGLTKTLVEQEIGAKCRAASVATRQPYASAGVEVFLMWLEPIAQGPRSALDLLETAESLGDGVLANLTQDVPENAPTQQSLQDMALELATFLYFTATLLEFFRNSLSEGVLKTAIEVSPEPGSIDSLARARQAFTTSPQSVWRRVSAFREAHGQQVLTYPS
jgi:hypothetical protein